MPKPIKGIFFRDLQNDYVAHIIKEIWFDKVYDQYFQGKSSLTVVDIGANVGLFSLYASQFARVVYAFEPSEQHMETLTTMLEYNEIGNVIPIRKAVGNFTGKGRFYHNQNTTMFSLRPEVNGLPTEEESVDVVTLDKLFEEQGLEKVDILKIDCEGSEGDIFGGDGFDKVADKIDLIVGEYHTWAGVNPNLFKSFFSDRNFDFEWLNATEASMFVARKIK